MPTPTFSELLEQARAVSQRQAESKETSFGESLYRGLTGFVQPFLKDRKQFVSTISPETGEISKLDRPVPEEPSILESMFGVKRPTEGVPLTQEQQSEFGLKSAFESRKQIGREKIVNLKILAQDKARELIGSRIGLDDVMPLSIWRAGLAEIGYDPDEIDFRTPRTYRAFNVLSTGRARNSQDFYRDIGIDVQIGKDILGQITPETKKIIEEKIQTRKEKRLFTPKERVYKTAEDVRDARDSGKIDKQEAIRILRDKFGFK